MVMPYGFLPAKSALSASLCQTQTSIGGCGVLTIRHPPMTTNTATSARSRVREDPPRSLNPHAVSAPATRSRPTLP